MKQPENVEEKLRRKVQARGVGEDHWRYLVQKQHVSTALSEVEDGQLDLDGAAEQLYADLAPLRDFLSRQAATASIRRTSGAALGEQGTNACVNAPLEQEGVRIVVDDDGRDGVVFPRFRDHETPQFPRSDVWTSRPIDAAGALNEFVSVQDERDVVHFGRSYGPLFPCSEHPPENHRGSICIWTGRSWPDMNGAVHRWRNPEPIAWWLDAARTPSAVLVAAGKINANEYLSAEDWRHLGGRSIWLEAQEEPDVSDDREGLAYVVNLHLDRYRIRPGLDGFFLDDFEVVWRLPPGFLPIPWGQAFAHILGGQLSVCSHCARPYVRAQRAKRGFANYCPQCGETNVRKRRSDKKRKAVAQRRPYEHDH